MIDQALLSAAGFALNLVLIRSWDPAMFGAYAVVVALSLIAYSVQNALIGTQLQSLRPVAVNRSDEHELVVTLWSANCLLMIGVAGLTWVVIAAIWHKQYPLLPLAAALFAGGNLLREYTRSFLFSELDVRTTLLLDASYVSVTAAGLLALWFWRGALELPFVCLLMAIVSVSVCVPIVLSRIDLFSLRLGDSARARYAKIWKGQSRWALLGAACSELMGRAHVFVVGSWYGAAAVGVLQAGEMLFRPLGLVAQAWERIAQPNFARLSAAGKWEAVRALAHISVWSMAGISSLYILTLWVGWPPLEREVFRGAYENIGFVLVLWSITATITVIAHVYGVMLQGLARFRDLSVTSVAGSFVSLAMLLLIVSNASFEWSILAIAMGRLVDLTLMQLILRRLFGTQRNEAPMASA
jgi:O-antigen/teichoic acid export membrane protein